MIYAIEAVGLDAVKIGFAKDDLALARRFDCFQVGSPVELVLLGAIRDGSERDEKGIHRELRSARLRGEWFRKSDVWPLIFDLFEEWQSVRCCPCCGSGFSLGSCLHERRGGSGLCKSCSNKASRHVPASFCSDCGKPRTHKARYNKSPRCRACAHQHLRKTRPEAFQGRLLADDAQGVLSLEKRIQMRTYQRERRARLRAGCM